MSGYMLAIDQGTSSTKSIVFSDQGRPIASAAAPLRTHYGSDGIAEQDPEEIYRSVIAATRTALSVFEVQHGGRRDRIVCAGLTNQRETFVLWDGEGRPVHKAVVWQCKRSVGVCAELKRAGAEPEIRSRTGLIVDPYFSGTKLTSILRTNGRAAAALQRRGLWFGTVDTWLLHRLTNGAAFSTDHSNASRTMMLNLHSLGWDEELLRLLEAPGLRLPEVHPSAHHYGDSNFEGLFSTAIPITAMIGDSHSAFFGQRCYRRGYAKATLGTGSSLLLNAGSTAPAPYPSSVSTVGFSIPGRVHYALEGVIVSAGSILTWLQRELGLYTESEELAPIATELESSMGVVVVPAHAGLGTPFWNMSVRGSIHGLTFGTNRKHIVRAALECIPYQIRAILDAVRTESGIECSLLAVDGGISRNGFVLQYLADTLGTPVRTYSFADVTALGAALLAGIGVGLYADVASIDALQLDETTIDPGTEAPTAAQGYAAWRSVVDGVTGC